MRHSKIPTDCNPLHADVTDSVYAWIGNCVCVWSRRGEGDKMPFASRTNLKVRPIATLLKSDTHKVHKLMKDKQETSS